MFIRSLAFLALLALSFGAELREETGPFDAKDKDFNDAAEELMRTMKEHRQKEEEETEAEKQNLLKSASFIQLDEKTKNRDVPDDLPDSDNSDDNGSENYETQMKSIFTEMQDTMKNEEKREATEHNNFLENLIEAKKNETQVMEGPWKKLKEGLKELEDLRAHKIPKGKLIETTSPGPILDVMGKTTEAPSLLEEHEKDLPDLANAFNAEAPKDPSTAFTADLSKDQETEDLGMKQAKDTLAEDKKRAAAAEEDFKKIEQSFNSPLEERVKMMQGLPKDMKSTVDADVRNIEEETKDLFKSAPLSFAQEKSKRGKDWPSSDNLDTFSNQLDGNHFNIEDSPKNPFDDIMNKHPSKFESEDPVFDPTSSSDGSGDASLKWDVQTNPSYVQLKEKHTDDVTGELQADGFQRTWKDWGSVDALPRRASEDFKGNVDNVHRNLNDALERASGLHGGLLEQEIKEKAEAFKKGMSVESSDEIGKLSLPMEASSFTELPKGKTVVSVNDKGEIHPHF